MKRIFRKIVTVAAALLLALPILLLAACDTVEPRSEADVIPEELGEAEGLWLYRGNKRSRTDGTEEETLLTSVTVEGQKYSEKEFSIRTYQYVRDTYEIFFVLSIKEQCKVFHYNYKTKESAELCSLPAPQNWSDYDIEASSSLVYIHNRAKDCGVIFSPDAQLLCENFTGGTLDGDIVYRISGGNFTYFKGDAVHEVRVGIYCHASDYQKYGAFVYFFSDAACGVNLDTEEIFSLTAIDDFGGSVHFEDIYCKEGVYYATAVYYVAYSGEEPQHIRRLFQVSGVTSQLLYEFGNTPYGLRMGIEGDVLYFTKKGARESKNEYFNYDTNTGKMRSVYRQYGGKGSTPEELEQQAAAKEYAEKKRAECTVGAYKFYVTSRGYDDQPGMLGGTHYTKLCYYLMRDCGGKSEIMQYNLNGNGGHFYDDIQEF